MQTETSPSSSEPKTVVLLGVPFHDVTFDETLAAIDRVIAERTPRYIATANLDFAAQASQDVELQRILLDAHLVLCDGMPLVWASRWLNAPVRERVTGSDLTPKLAAHAAARGYRLFFLGSDDEVLNKAKTTLEARHPGINICGTYAPPYAKLLDLNHEEIAQRIRAAQPDILLVALGAPKQEKWIYMHHRELGVPCSIGIGASLDFIAGKFSRAPVWMRVTGLEWVYRLMQEPRRLFARYAFDFSFFVRAFRAQKRALRRQSPALESAKPAPAQSSASHFALHVWNGRADATAVAAGTLAEPLPQGDEARIALDTSAVTFIDSTGLGLILKGFKAAKVAGGELVLLRPSECVRQMLSMMKLDRLIRVAADETEARNFLRVDNRTPRPLTEFEPDTKRLVCRCAGELSLSVAETFAATLLTGWTKNPSAQCLHIDLTEVDFMDSSGLGCLVRARKLVHTRPGAQLQITGANENVRNVIQLAQMRELLGVA